MADDDAAPPQGPAQIETAIAAGDYQAASRMAAAAGDLTRAQALLEKVWDFAGAAAIAELRSDRVAALRLHLEARDVARAAEVTAALVAEGNREALSQAAEVCERKRMWREAAAFRERAGEPALSRALYERAGLYFEAGRLDQQLGRYREAGMAYERFLREPPPDDRGAAARAQLALGRVLGVLGRHEEAARHLQAAVMGHLGATPTSSEITNSENGQEGGQAVAAGTVLFPHELRAAREQLVASLAALGMRDGARHVLETLQAEAAASATGAPPGRDPDAYPPLAPPASTVPGGVEPADEVESLDAFLARRARETGGDLLAGRYEVVRLLGSGGMGRVYLARDRVTDEEVAVKVVAAPADPRAREGYRRFLREARVVSLLAHPNIVAVREVREDEGLLVMEHMAGGTLEGRLSSLPVGLAKALLLQVVRGLQAAHARGVIHRDIKPANIFLSRTGEAKLGDFGVAHLADLGATQTAGFIGTLAYMAPEQVTGAPLTFACDVYALGITAFQMLTGRLPFEGPDFVSDHLGRIPPPPSSLRPHLHSFDALILRMLEKDPARRHATLDELSRQLEAIPIGDEKTLHAEAVPAFEAPPQPLPPSSDLRYRIEADLASTPFSTLHRAVDERLGRPVLLERFTAGAFAGEAGAARLAWVRAMAKSGGPHLQRVLRFDHAEGRAEEGAKGDGEALTEGAGEGRAEGGAPGRAVYESVVGTPAAALPQDPVAAARLALDVLRALSMLHREGAAHGDVVAAIVVEPGGRATLTVSGRAFSAVPPPTPAGDLAALATLLRQLTGDPVPDGDAAAIAAWARARLSEPAPATR